MKKVFKTIGLLLLLFIIYAASKLVWFLYSEYSERQQVDAHLAGEAPVLIINGTRYRDLNKNGLLDTYETNTAPIDARINDLLAQMSVEEKVGLMFHSVIPLGKGDAVNQGGDMVSIMFGDSSTNIAVRKINHFNLFDSAPIRDMARWNNAVQKMAEKTRLGIPITVSTDPRHSLRDFGAATSIFTEGFSLWPEPLGLGALDDTDVTEQFGRVANAEYRAIGLRVALHPMADLATEPRWGRIIGTFGEDADVSARQVAAYVKGFQGETINTESVITMTKHFSGGGPQENGDDAHFHYGRNQVYPGNNFDYHLKPFEAAFAAGTGQIMPYYGIPVGQTSEDVAFAFNKDIITTLLREKYGFDGVVCADWSVITPMGAWRRIGLINSRGWGVDHLNVKQKFKKAVDAGIDQFGGEHFPAPLVALVKEGKISEQRIDQSARRILRDKFRLGLFDNPYVDVASAESKTKLPEYVKAGAYAQRASHVLLKNANNVLPLSKGVKIYIENIDPEIAAQYGNVVSSPSDADFAILRLQTPTRNASLHTSFIENMMENYFRQGDLDFETDELARLEAIMAQVPTVVNIYLDRPAVIPEIAAQTVGLLANFGVGDTAILDVIFGNGEPKGKLPFEMPSSMAAVKSQLEDVPYDSEKPLYPFGFGLRYSETVE